MSKGLGEWDEDLDDAAADVAEPVESTEDAPELFYADVAAFVAEKLAPGYRRRFNQSGAITWCPQWWKHGEAISRLEALWRAWEFLRLDGATGMSVWWRDHADHHMSVLMSPDGPFSGCGPSKGHSSTLPPLPCEEPPEGLF
ncbi:DUF4913 domain-containing protein [Arthrobacter crystallopoietes]|uniref:DUF4913 domain-containing protein n=1 Tax=Crystallibacter crystallopoietes TaxID=37928 RepID=UPI0011114C3D|nr:DUF4913 domain-containing protein [Arthrobacter crystallopoietes]